MFCSNPSDVATEGTLRLAGAAVAGEGRVQIFHDGEWVGVTISDKNCYDVVCKQLGYLGRNTTGGTIEFEVPFTGPVLLDVIDCDGSEDSLLESLHRWNDGSELHNAEVRCIHPGILKVSTHSQFTVLKFK